MPFLIILLIISLLIGLLVATALLYFSTKGTVRLVRTLRREKLPLSVTRSLEESRRYGRLIMDTVQRYPEGPVRNRLNQVIKPVDEWLAKLTELEQALEKLYGQRKLTRELRQTKFELDQLQRRLRTGAGGDIAALQALIESKQNHYATLKELQTFQTQAELKIQKISSDLGATHAEMLLITARGDFNHNRLHRLDENLQEHMAGLKDLLSAMEEMGYSGALN